MKMWRMSLSCVCDINCLHLQQEVENEDDISCLQLELEVEDDLEL